MCLWVQPRVFSSLPVHSAAASGPAGVVELSNDPRKAVLMNSAHPSSTPRHPSSIHPFISPCGATLRGHIRPLTYEDEHADQQCYECPGAESCAHYVGCGIACLDGSICVVKKKKRITHTLISKLRYILSIDVQGNMFSSCMPSKCCSFLHLEGGGVIVY